MNGQIMESKNYKAEVIPPDTIKDVHIPFIVVTPKNGISGPPILTFNNDGRTSLDDSVQYNLSGNDKNILSMAETMQLRGIAVMPIIPSEEEFQKSLDKDMTFQRSLEESETFEMGDAKTLCRECFDPRIPDTNQFYRLDKQIDTILEHVKSEYMKSDENFIGFGHSGAGKTTIRYEMISPGHIDKMIIGGNADEIPILTGENADNFIYPLGMKDYKKLFPERTYDENAYKNTSYNFYISRTEDQPMRDDGRPRYDLLCAKNYGIATDENNRKSGPKFCPETAARQYRRGYGENMMERFNNVMNDYKESGMNIHVKIYNREPHASITLNDFQNLIYQNDTFDDVSDRDSTSQQWQEYISR